MLGILDAFFHHQPFSSFPLLLFHNPISQIPYSHIPILSPISSLLQFLPYPPRTILIFAPPHLSLSYNLLHHPFPTLSSIQPSILSILQFVWNRLFPSPSTISRLNLHLFVGPLLYWPAGRCFILLSSDSFYFPYLSLWGLPMPML